MLVTPVRTAWGPVLYRVRRRIGLSAIGPKAALITGIVASLGLAGCSLSRSEDAFAKYESPDVTGSIAPAAQQDGEPTDADLAFARNAASDVLTKGGADSSQPWENPTTGARGSVTPISSTFTQDGRRCRHFLASYVRERQERWLQGAACRTAQGRWEIQSLSTWRKS